MKIRKMARRISSAAICAAIMAGSVFGGLTASAATESSVSFSDYSNNLTATNEYYSDKLEYYYNSSDSRFEYMTVKPTATYTDLDVWARADFGKVDGKERGLTVYDRIGAMSPKDASGKLV